MNLPAEWSPHRATWLAWPSNRHDWPGKLSAAQWAYTEMVRKIAAGEQIHLLVPSKNVEQRVRRTLKRAHVDLSQVISHGFPTNRSWLRDTGPLFVKVRDQLSVAHFGFNAWAKYDDWQLDAEISAYAAKRLGLPLVEVRHRQGKVALEGGAFDVNGSGTLIATEECLLDPEVQVRNPGFTREDYERVFRTYLGIRHVIWLGRGIAGDDTHGHVDDLCRFVNENTVVLGCETDSTDVNYAPLAQNRERLQSARLQDGSKLEVVELPMPSPLLFNGRRLPASYANFYVCNAAVLVPTFNDPQDRNALGILAELITDRQVVGIHAVDLVWGLGTLHCLTQQQPLV